MRVEPLMNERKSCLFLIRFKISFMIFSINQVYLHPINAQCVNPSLIRLRIVLDEHSPANSDSESKKSDNSIFGSRSRRSKHVFNAL